MARWMEPTEKQEAAFAEWMVGRPPVIVELAKRFDIWTLYRLKTTNQRITIDSFCEDGTLKVIVSGRYNFVMHDRRVFGIKADDLEPCDLPGADDPVGNIFDYIERAES